MWQSDNSSETDPGEAKDVALDASGNIYVSGTMPQGGYATVVKYDSGFGRVAEFGTGGKATYSTDSTIFTSISIDPVSLDLVVAGYGLTGASDLTLAVVGLDSTTGALMTDWFTNGAYTMAGALGLATAFDSDDRLIVLGANGTIFPTPTNVNVLTFRFK